MQADIRVAPSIEAGLAHCRETAKASGGQVDVLVTGSVHLIGGFLEIFETEQEREHATTE